ncbi:MAG TPA: hypothetical protein VML50_18390, partial [Anaeromyxobacter sp.]|nr:hypothetical protein [Anaeromyxobacter sp.]
MAVSGISSATSVASVDLSQVDLTQIDPSGLPPATQSSISPEGGLMGELSELSQSDPSKFKAVMQEIAEKLQGEASQASGDKAQALGNLADKFDQAAQTGDMSSLQPSGAQKHH